MKRRWLSLDLGLAFLLGLSLCGNEGSEVGSSSSPATGGRPEIESHGNVTVLAGQTGTLKCRVTNPANYTVSWLRHRDMHLLTSGVDAYTADPRFRSYQGPGHTWGLRISTTRASDTGIYECQISTTPPIPAFAYLSVVEPVTHIEGLSEKRSELFIKAGSTINLTCVVEDATENAPKHILWRHNSKMINFEWARGGMSLVTEKKTKGVTVSRLLIQKAVRTDSGVYQCAPQNAHPAYVKIHVLEQGEKQAAMQSRSPPSASLLCPITPLLLLSLCLTLLPTVIPSPSYNLDKSWKNRISMESHCYCTDSICSSLAQDTTSCIYETLTFSSIKMNS